MAEHLTFEDRAAFRAWLTQSGASSPGVWLIFGKKGGPKTLSAVEALEEALCFGWIDGQMERLDDTQYRKYFARRVPGSKWSQKNKGIVEGLLARRMVTDAGLAAIEAAKRDGGWDRPPRPQIGEAEVEMFRGLVVPYGLAHKNLMGMSPSVQRTYTGFYLDAKSEETRARRLAKIVERLEQNLKPM